VSPDDEAIIAKAILLGCKFNRSMSTSNHRFYPGLNPQHSLSRAKYASSGFYGYDDPVEMAHDYVAFFMGQWSCPSPPETS